MKYGKYNSSVQMDCFSTGMFLKQEASLFFAAGAQLEALLPGFAVLCSPVPGVGEMPSSVSLNTIFLTFWSRILSLCSGGAGVVSLWSLTH